MENADHIIDLGPEAGINGGKCSCTRRVKRYFEKLKIVLQVSYLSHKKKYTNIPNKRRLAKNGRYLEILGATGNNLKNVNLKNSTRDLYLCNWCIRKW